MLCHHALLSIIIFSLFLLLFSFFAGVSVYAFEITDYEYLSMELNVDALLPIIESLLLSLPADLLQAVLITGKGAVFSPMLYSTLFASIWLWRFLFAPAVIRTLEMRKTLSSSTVSIESKPLRAIGAFAGGVCAVSWWMTTTIKFFG